MGLCTGGHSCGQRNLPQTQLTTEGTGAHRGGTEIYRNYPSGSERLSVDNSCEVEVLSGDRAMITDPVCGIRVDDNDLQHQARYGGQTYSFCSQQCKNEFEENPELYANLVA